MKKPCRKCGLVAEHYASSPTSCKECTKARVRANRAANADYYRAFDRKRNQLPHRKAAFIKKTRRLRQNTPGMQLAHSKVRYAVSTGKMIKPLRCSRCGAKGDLEGHHDDYSKPLEVMWLCLVCHAQRHKELGRLSGTKK